MSSKYRELRPGLSCVNIKTRKAISSCQLCIHSTVWKVRNSPAVPGRMRSPQAPPRSPPRAEMPNFREVLGWRGRPKTALPVSPFPRVVFPPCPRDEVSQVPPDWPRCMNPGALNGPSPRSGLGPLFLPRRLARVNRPFVLCKAPSWLMPPW